MSITVKKRDHQAARIEAEDLIEQFAGTYAKWEVVGSVRRKSADCGDVDHLVIPIIVEKADPASLFAVPRPVNLLWERADEMVKSGLLAKYPRGADGFCWGNKYRSTMFRQAKHDIFTADKDSWGPQLTIRTGPCEFSKRMVTGLLQNNRRNIDGYVWKCRKRKQCDEELPCIVCNGSGLCPDEQLSVNTEAEYFELCGVTFCKPEDRR